MTRQSFADVARAAKADAVVAIVVARVVRVTADELADIVGITPADVRASLERMRARHRPQRRLRPVRDTPPEGGAIARSGMARSGARRVSERCRWSGSA